MADKKLTATPEILNYLLAYTGNPKAFEKMVKEVSEDQNLLLDEHNLRLFLLKLRKDKYVDFVAGISIQDNLDAVEGVTIRRNIDGNLFLENGGYIKQVQKDKIDVWNKRLINFSLIFGGVAAGCYYTFELLKPVIKALICYFSCKS